MEKISLKTLGGPNERHASFWLASQELMANDFQKDIDRMKREIVELKLENYTLKMKCGELQEKLCSRCLTTEDCDLFKHSMISWGDVANFLTAEQMGFYQELLIFSIHNWIKPESSGFQILVPPSMAFQKRIQEVLENSDSQELEATALNSLGDFVVSIIYLREYDISHQDVKILEEVFKGILRKVSSKDSPRHHSAESLLKVFMDRDASRCIITRTICKMTADLSRALCEEVIGADESVAKTKNYTALMDLDFLELCSLCQICIAQLSKWSNSNYSQAALLREIADHVWKISKYCDILSALSPAMAFEGKRLYCRLIASLQDMDA